MKDVAGKNATLSPIVVVLQKLKPQQQAQVLDVSLKKFYPSCRPCLWCPLEQGLCSIMRICIVSLSYGLCRPCEISPSLTVCTAIQKENHFLSLSPPLSLLSPHVLEIKRENPISAVTFCLCSRNIQRLYIKARQGAQ